MIKETDSVRLFSFTQKDRGRSPGLFTFINKEALAASQLPYSFPEAFIFSTFSLM